MRLACGALLCAAGSAHAAPKRVLLVAAAANLRPALEQVKTAFEAANPGIEVRPTFGASGVLFAQVQNGAPFDVFLAADAEYPSKLVAAKLAAASSVYAYGKLVLWVPPGSTLDERRGLAVLAEAPVTKVAIGNPALAPYGAAAKQALEAQGLYERVKHKLVLGQGVAQAAQFAHSGNAQAALLPLALVLAPPLDAGRYVAVPERDYARIEQAGAVLAGARSPTEARAFFDFLRGKEGRAILEKSGYGLPPD